MFSFGLSVFFLFFLVFAPSFLGHLSPLIVDFLGIYRDLPSLPQPTSLLFISMAWGVGFMLGLGCCQQSCCAWTVGGRLWPGFQ